MAFAKIQPGVKFGHNLPSRCTIAYRIAATTKEIEFGLAYQHSNDTYNHKLGRQIAQGRLLKCGHFSGSIPFRDYVAVHGDKLLNHADIIQFIDLYRSTEDHLIPAADLKVIKDSIGAWNSDEALLTLQAVIDEMNKTL